MSKSFVDTFEGLLQSESTFKHPVQWYLTYPVRRGCLRHYHKCSLFQQCASDANELMYVTGSVPQDGSVLNPK